VSRARPRAGRSWASDRTLAVLFALPTAVLLLVLVVYPFVQAAADSLYRVNMVTRASSYVGLGNYASLAQSPEVRAALGRTLLWTASNLAVQTGLGLTIALLLNAGLTGQTLARGLVLFPYMVPAIVAALVFRFLFHDVVGVVNYLLISAGVLGQPVSWLSSPDSALWAAIVVNCWKYTPFMVIVFLGRLQTVPRDLYDAARIDGANAWGEFRYVTFAWLRPVLLVAMLLRTIWTVNDFDLIYLLAFGGPLQATTTIPVLIRGIAFSQLDAGLASALAVWATIPLCLASWLYLRLYRRSEADLQ
jgi:multiple sugar transport system permease protein